MKKLNKAVMFTVALAFATVSAGAGVDRFTSISPEGTVITAMVIDPSRPSTVYATSPYAGVFKSLDGGIGWTLVFDLETIRDNPVTQRRIARLVMDPKQHSTLYAVIVRDRPDGSGTAGEIVKTVDAGVTWALLPGWEKGFIRDLIIDPSSPDSLYALTFRTLFKSVDGGLSWRSLDAGVQPIFPGELRNVAIEPSLPSRLYLSSTRGLYVSNDRGESWQLLLLGEGFGLIVVDRGDSAILYAPTPRGLLGSRDGGKTWTVLIAAGVHRIVTDPLSSRVSVVVNRRDGGAGTEILVTADQGQTWLPLPSARMLLLAVEPGSTHVFYATSDGELFKSEDRGEGWRPVQSGLNAPFVSDIATDPAGSLFAGTVRGMVKSADGGKNWRELNNDLRPTQLSIHPRDPSTLFAHNFQTASRSTDGGGTWTAINPGRNVTGIAIDPTDSANVYAVLYDGLSRSRDGGSTWAAVGTGQLPLAYYGFEGGAIAVDPATPANIYAAGGGAVLKSVDAGTNWKVIFTPSGFYGQYIHKLLIDPSTPSTIYALGYSTLYRSYDEGRSWKLAYFRPQGAGHFTDLDLDPINPSRLYLATNGGLLTSSNRGDLWTDFSDGLPTMSVNAVSTDLRGNVYAATSRGLSVRTPRFDSLSTASVSLRTLLGNYVSANNCGGSSVNANAMQAGPCELFTIYDLNGGALQDGDKIHLRSANGQFAAAENGGSLDHTIAPVNANRRLPAAWETFVIRRQGGGTAIASGDSIALQSINGTYLAAEGGGANNCDCDSRLNANRFEVREWETFVIEMR